MIIGFVLVPLAFVNLIIYFFWSRPELKISDLATQKAVSAGPLIIKTDKDKYAPGELVKISYSNQALKAIAEASSTGLSIDSYRFLGNNYGVGLIEKFIEGKWLAIEPVWRCNLDCFSPCREERRIPQAAQKVFYWKQTMLVCSNLGEKDQVVNVEPGLYRVVSAVWDEKLRDYKMIHSNQFDIK